VGICPNYEVVPGTRFCAIVRRFGFPHSQVHPLFTPVARFFIDVKYTFYASAPYFLTGRTDGGHQDFTLNYSRGRRVADGRSIVHPPPLMDEAGHIHEGDVPAEHADRLWESGSQPGQPRRALRHTSRHDLDVPPGAARTRRPG